MKGLGPRSRASLVALYVAGLTVRLAIASQTPIQRIEAHAFHAVLQALQSHPWQLYSSVNGEFSVPVFGISYFAWPYPGGFLPWILLSGALSSHALDFDFLIKLPATVADVGIAWIVQAELGRREYPAGARLLAAGIVLASPVFGVESAYHGQIESVAVFPALLGAILYRRGGRYRVLGAVLVGVGASIKTPMLLVALAMAASVRTWRERIMVPAVAAAIPVVTVIPFLVADPRGVVAILAYSGVPGYGGLSLIANLRAPLYGILHTPVTPTSASVFLAQHGALISLACVLLAAGWIALRKLDLLDAAALMWAVFYICGTGFAIPYLIWGIPFVLVAGYVLEGSAMLLLAAVPELEVWNLLRPPRPIVLYDGLMLALWGAVVGFVLTMRTRWVPSRFIFRWRG